MTEQHCFSVKNCALAAIAIGEHVASLVGLRDKLVTVPADCLYYHFWGGRLGAQFTYPEYHNDFAMWVHQSLHDEYLAERLGIIDPTEYSSLETLRTDLVEIVEQRLEDYDMAPFARRGDLFHFVRSSLIVFETPYQIDHPRLIPKFLPLLSPRSVFFHFIDARTRTPEKIDDFSTYLSMYGDEYSTLVGKIRSIDPYFLSLSELKEELLTVVCDHFGTKRESEAL